MASGDQNNSSQIIQKELSSLQESSIDGFSGALGGVVGQLIFYPLENFRTRLQAESQGATWGSNRQNIFQEFQRLCKIEGYLSFYKGLKMALIATIASYGSYFFAYKSFKKLIARLLKIQESQFSKRHIALITALSGSLSVLFANPFWFLNTRMTLHQQKAEESTKPVVQKNWISLARDIYKSQGIAAFYNGVMPGMILVLNPIINFVVYEAMVKYFKGKKKNARAIHIFIASSLGKLLATLATYPILTVRVKLQAKKKLAEHSRYEQYMQILRQLTWLDYYRGMEAKLLQTILYNAFLLLTYEKMRIIIKKMVV